jgi:hypothetical protein
MPRASDVDMDLGNGERVEIKYVHPYRVKELTIRISDSAPQQAKKITIPAIVSE